MDEIDKLQLAALGQHHPAGAAALAEILERLATLTPQAQARWERNQQDFAREVANDYPDDPHEIPAGALWLALEYAPGARSQSTPWACGWRVQPASGIEWALAFGGATPLEAAQKALAEASRWTLEGARR